MKRLKPPVPMPRLRAAARARLDGSYRPQLLLPPPTLSHGVTLPDRWCRPRETCANHLAVSFNRPRMWRRRGTTGAGPTSRSAAPAPGSAPARRLASAGREGHGSIGERPRRRPRLATAAPPCASGLGSARRCSTADETGAPTSAARHDTRNRQTTNDLTHEHPPELSEPGRHPGTTWHAVQTPGPSAGLAHHRRLSVGRGRAAARGCTSRAARDPGRWRRRRAAAGCRRRPG